MKQIKLYHIIKRVSILAVLLIAGNALLAQQDEETDSIRILSDELRRINDTIPGSGSIDTDNDETYADSIAPTANVYFLRKDLQENDGIRDSLQVRRLPDSTVRRFRADEDFWYVNYIFKKEKKEEPDKSVPFTQTRAFETLLWLIIVGGFAAFVVIYLANSNIGIFRKGHKTIAGAIESEDATENIFEINYQREIERAIANANYRLATRLMFLRALKNLSDKKVIQYKQDRTNFDYLMQLHSTKYYNDFFRLTRNYEYSWYGQFAIEPEKFNIIKDDFENFTRNLSQR